MYQIPIEIKLVYILVLIVAMVFVSSLFGCAKPNTLSVGQVQSGCKIYDACTYVNGNLQYPCVQKEYFESAHPEITASYFGSQTCIWTREDWDPIKDQQGPGPLAIPQLNL